MDPSKNEPKELPVIEKLAPASPEAQTEAKIESLTGPEQSSEVFPEAAPDKEASLKQELPSPAMPKPVQLSPAGGKARLVMAVENVLEKDLKEVYKKMSPDKKALFKKVGEETAVQVASLIKQAQLKIGQIFDLIKRWLMLIPGVNIFFLEQEAKIKTDGVINLREELKKKGEI